MGARIILIGCIWIFLPILYMTWRNNLIWKKNLLLSVTLPPEAREDEEVACCLEAFRKTMRRSFWLQTAALLPALFFPWISVSVTWSLVWMVAALVGSSFVYGKGYRQMKAIKRRRGWQTAAAGKAAAELTPMKLPRPVRAGWFWPPMLVSVLPVISCLADPQDPARRVLMAVTAVSGLLITGLSLAFSVRLCRGQTDVAEHPLLTQTLSRVRQYNWGKLWLLISWLTGIYSLSVWIGGGKGYVCLTVLYTVFVLAAVLAAEFAVRRVQQRLSGKSVPVVDEDDYWIWGQFYYNPNNCRTFVPERVGMGMSVNYAARGGRVMARLCALVLLALIPLGIWMMTEEFSSVELQWKDGTVTVCHGMTVYQFEEDSVKSAVLLDRLPACSRIWGTGMDRILKGSFTVESWGTARLCLDPQKPPFLLVQTEHGNYLLGGDRVRELGSRLEGTVP